MTFYICKVLDSNSVHASADKITGRYDSDELTTSEALTFGRCRFLDCTAFTIMYNAVSIL